VANLHSERALVRADAAPLTEDELAERGRSARVRRPYALAVYTAVLVLFVGAGLFAPLIAPYDPAAQKLVNRLHPPVWQAGGAWAHPLGTDSLGRDELSRLMYGARISLIVVAVSVPASVVLGTLLGLLAGYRSRTVGVLLMRLVDVQLALPPILFAILLAAVLGGVLAGLFLARPGRQAEAPPPDVAGTSPTPRGRWLTPTIAGLVLLIPVETIATIGFGSGGALWAGTAFVSACILLQTGPLVSGPSTPMLSLVPAVCRNAGCPAGYGSPGSKAKRWKWSRASSSSLIPWR